MVLLQGRCFALWCTRGIWAGFVLGPVRSPRNHLLECFPLIAAVFLQLSLGMTDFSSFELDLQNYLILARVCLCGVYCCGSKVHVQLSFLPKAGISENSHCYGSI